MAAYINGEDPVLFIQEVVLDEYKQLLVDLEKRRSGLDSIDQFKKKMDGVVQSLATNIFMHIDIARKQNFLKSSDGRHIVERDVKDVRKYQKIMHYCLAHLKRIHKDAPKGPNTIAPQVPIHASISFCTLETLKMKEREAEEVKRAVDRSGPLETIDEKDECEPC